MVLAIAGPVPAAPPTTGLVASVPLTNDSRWEQGFSWRPERCPINYDGYSSCTPYTKDPVDSAPGITHYIPPGFMVEDECTTLDGLRDEARIRRQVEAITSRVVAQELWSGQISIKFPGTVKNDTSYVNPFLADGTANLVSGTFSDYAAALAALEAEAMDASNGQQIFLHIPTRWLFPIAEKVRRVGNVIYTQLDNVIISDAGYPKAGNTAYATGPVQLRLSAIDVFVRPEETISRATNKQKIIGERLFAATYDPCIHYSVTVTDPN